MEFLRMSLFLLLQSFKFVAAKDGGYPFKGQGVWFQAHLTTFKHGLLNDLHIH
jgi:hypothetical protein